MLMGGKLTVSRSDEPLAADHDNDDDDVPFALTDHERQLIDSTWKQLTASGEADCDADEELGVRVFMRIFELDPAVMDAFPHFGALPDLRAMRRNVMFRMHGRRFLRAVRSVVDNLDSLGVTAVPNLDLLGRKHRDFHGFRTDYLRSFEAAMEDVWREELGRRFDKTTRRAWRKVFKLITSTVMHGYEEKKTRAADTATAVSEQTTAATPNDINGSLQACNDTQTDCGLSS